MKNKVNNQRDELLEVSHETLLTRRIEYKKAVRSEDNGSMNLRKYEKINKTIELPLNGKNGKIENKKENKKDTQNDTTKKQNNEEKEKKGVEYLWSVRGKPKTVLYERKQIEKYCEWEEIKPVGCGLNNLGNTCFLNSALQCLTYTPILGNLFSKKVHTTQCQSKEFCMFCVLERNYHQVNQKNSKASITPSPIVKNLRVIGKHFRQGRQEDSHEFIRYVIDHMHQNCLKGFRGNSHSGNQRNGFSPKGGDIKLTKNEQETSLIYGIFGGMLQSQVRCQKCFYESDTFDPFLDLSLELKNCNSLSDAFLTFCRSEKLDKNNQYRCEKCSQFSQAQKQLTIFQSPYTLMIHLKRFNEFGKKINKPIQFPEKFKLNQFMSRRSEKDEEEFGYDLYAVLVHEGHSIHSGHYFCFIKNSSGVWYEMNDQSVRQVSKQTVLNQHAYILFYHRSASSLSKKPSPPSPSPSLSNPTSPAPNGKKSKNPPANSPAKAHSAPNSPRNGTSVANSPTIITTETNNKKQRKNSENLTPNNPKKQENPLPLKTTETTETIKRIAENLNKNKNKRKIEALTENSIATPPPPKRQKLFDEVDFEESLPAKKPWVSKDVNEDAEKNKNILSKNWDERTLPNGKKALAPKNPKENGKINQQKITTNKKELEEFFNQQKEELPAWFEDKQTKQIKKAIDQTISQRTQALLAVKPDARDNYDLDYDKGKLKKIRKKKLAIISNPNRVNKFQVKFAMLQVCFSFLQYSG